MSRLPECLELMAKANVDVMVLGREANTRAVVDTNRLWLAGTRPFSPGCVVVRATGAVHVLANSDDAVPAGFPRDRLFGITWNPEKLAAALGAIDGVSEARGLAVDGMTPMMATMLTGIAPAARFTDAGALLADLARAPDPAAVTGVEAAAEIARAGLAAMAAELVPDVRPRALRGACAAAFAAAGVTTPAFEGVAAPLEIASSTWISPERLLAEGERVVLRAGVLRDGWEASLARTYVVSVPSVEQSPPTEWNEALAACVAGMTAGAVRGRDAVIYGVGHGVDPWADDVVLVPGMMCALECADDARLHQEILRITDGEPVVVTRSA